MIVHSFLHVYQRVNLDFPVVFLWFSYGLPEGKQISCSTGWILTVGSMDIPRFGGSIVLSDPHNTRSILDVNA